MPIPAVLSRDEDRSQKFELKYQVSLPCRRVLVPKSDPFRRRFNRALRGILFSFVGLLLSVTIRFGLNVPWNPVRIILASGTLAALFFNVRLLYPVIAGIVVSLLLL